MAVLVGRGCETHPDGKLFYEAGNAANLMREMKILKKIRSYE